MEELWFNKAGNTGMPHADPDVVMARPTRGVRKPIRKPKGGPRKLEEVTGIAISQQTEAMRLERIAKNKKNLLECAKELGVDRDTVDALMSRDGKTKQKLFGILPRAKSGCRTQECQEQNSASARSIIDFQNSELGKKLECLEQCAEIKMFARQNSGGLGSTKMIEEINYRYNSKCGSFKEDKKKKKTNYLPLVLAGVVILLLLKK
tara:strand:+ start:103 stop:720 length:618 start_codon:yes stop_codon:yes gene_type:complete